MGNCSSLGLTWRNRVSPNTWSSGVAHQARDGEPSCTIMPRISPPWTCSLFQLSALTCYAFVIVRLDRRDLVWINVTRNPAAEWVARQITEAFPWDDAPKYLLRDRDQIYGAVVTRRLRAMGIRDRPTAPASPWQNGFAERLIGPIRRECLDHIVVLGEARLLRILRSYARYYNDLNASVIGQRRAGYVPGSAGRKNKDVPHPRRTPSPLPQSLGIRYIQASRREAEEFSESMRAGGRLR